MKILFALLALLLTASPVAAAAPDTTAYKFTVVKELKITPVKNQNRSSTCWSFSGLGLVEAELLRMGKEEADLSEMFVVYTNYVDQAKKYVRLHGDGIFSPGGSFADVLYTMQHYGAVPEEAMRGLEYGEDIHSHNELDTLTKAYVDAVVKNPNRKLSPAWEKGFKGILDAYLGEIPANFTYKGKSYTPKSFAASLGFNAGDYVSLTSFTHHPFYTEFAIEIPDNWRWATSYNLPLDEFMQVLDNAINAGYTIAWGSDVSEKGFNREGVAIVPDVNPAELSGSDQARWLGFSPRERDAQLLNFYKPGHEKTITQELRQAGFDNYETTDDHGMLIHGIATDQHGTKYYMVKNSWGETGKYKGLWYASEAFVKYKTINIVVHKNALPATIKAKLGVK
ncbi:MAG: aminopeptidase [Prevotellaceae bacterium]|jgi:aminopeptidase C|nr:aminopeptidase [Prevotellaceae bacterium]